MTEIPPPDCPAAVIFIGAMLCSGTDSLLLVLDRGLRSSKSCDGDAERAAGDVRQANLVAEFDALGVAAVFTAEIAGVTGRYLFACNIDFGYIVAGFFCSTHKFIAEQIGVAAFTGAAG